MVFSSITFLFVFLPVLLLAYFLLPKSCRNIVLLLASLFFYAWGEPVYVILMILSIAFNYFCGREIAQESNDSRKKMHLIFSIVVDIGVLALFKYCTFLHLSLPIGISFYTFQALSYIIDVYRGDAPVQKNILNFALYITMFPQLIAGPIVRYVDIDKQLAGRKVTPVTFGAGMRRFILGLGKKAILANGIGAIFSEITANGAGHLAVGTAWIAAFAYTLQIYFDFSGYSDMAIGLGKMFGFTFNENFRLPYTSKSVTEFWRRWHISLGTWFREYVYIPLGGNRKGKTRHIINMLIIWTLTGIWHGASLNFMAWGFYFGVLMVFERYVWGGILGKLPGFLQNIYCMFLVVISWVLFSASNMKDAVISVGNLFGIGSSGLLWDSVASAEIMYHLGLWIIGIFACTGLCRKLLDQAEARRDRTVLVNIGYILVFVIAVSCLITDSYNPFLYFRF